jgi:hypothetical protein
VNRAVAGLSVGLSNFDVVHARRAPESPRSRSRFRQRAIHGYVGKSIDADNLRTHGLSLGKEQVVNYRLYFMNRAGHVVHAVDLEADADDQAIQSARGHDDGRLMELWRGDDRVLTWIGDREPTRASSC